MRDGPQEIAGRTIEVSNADKVFFPDDGLTKGGLIAFYADIAETALPYLDDRPAVLIRYPDGIAGSRFFQKNASDHFPDWLRTVPVEKVEGGTVQHVVIDEPAAFAYLADQGAIELHAWPSRADNPGRPDQAIFDLDPPGDEPAAARSAARRVRDLLSELGLTCLLKTSGSKGFHVHVVLEGRDNFDQVRGFCGDVARLLARRHPEELTVERRKEQRAGRLYLDVERNAYGQHAVAPYTVRARPGAPVATPVDWEELDGLSPRSYTAHNVLRRLAQKPDPWAGAWRRGQSLTEPCKRLADLRQAADG